jgi:precorrin-6A synthase
MRRICVIGIGAGDPEQLTLRAVRALGSTDVFFVLDKGQEGSDPARLRREIIEAHAGSRPWRLVRARDPERDRRPGDRDSYTRAVGEWRARRADLYERFITAELGENETGAFLVWGDPSLYDSTLSVLEEVRRRDAVAFELEVVPGVSSVSALLARHGTGLTRVGRPVQITTGRQLAAGWPEGVDDLVVMLDAHQEFTRITRDDVWIWWGAYVGTPDEILVSGRLVEVADRIAAVRAEARARRGWIMDTYLLRRG